MNKDPLPEREVIIKRDLTFGFSFNNRKRSFGNF